MNAAELKAWGLACIIASIGGYLFGRIQDAVTNGPLFPEWVIPLLFLAVGAVLLAAGAAEDNRKQSGAL